MNTGTALDTLKPGAYVYVAFGGKGGRQLAKIVRGPYAKGSGTGIVWVVKKYRAQSKRWTLTISVSAAEILDEQPTLAVVQRAIGTATTWRPRVPLVLHRSGCSDPNCDAIGCRP